jgi:hypothetical protein
VFQRRGAWCSRTCADHFVALAADGKHRQGRTFHPQQCDSGPSYRLNHNFLTNASSFGAE